MATGERWNANSVARMQRLVGRTTSRTTKAKTKAKAKETEAKATMVVVVDW